MTRPSDHARAPVLNASHDPLPAQGEGLASGRGCSGRAYGAAHGHMTARYWSRHATWKVTCALSGKVTVTASPCTGWAHHAQGWTGCPCLCRGRVAFALFLPFRRFTGGHASHMPWPSTPPAHAESLTLPPRASGTPAAEQRLVTRGRRVSPGGGHGVEQAARVKDSSAPEATP